MAENTADQNALASGRAFVWHECHVPSREKAVEFYTQALGFGSQDMPMGEMGTYTMLTINGTPVCGVMGTDGTPAEGTPPYWATYLAVDDVDARLASVEAHGGATVVPPMNIPTVGRMALIRDPQGAHIWLFKAE